VAPLLGSARKIKKRGTELELVYLWRRKKEGDCQLPNTVPKERRPISSNRPSEGRKEGDGILQGQVLRLRVGEETGSSAIIGVSAGKKKKERIGENPCGQFQEGREKKTRFFPYHLCRKQKKGRRGEKDPE